MNLVIGTILLCNFNFYGINSYNVRLKNVPATILASTYTKIVLEYDLANIANFEYFSEDQKVIEIVSPDDITSNYLNCRETGKHQESK